MTTQTRRQKMAARRKMFARLVTDWCGAHWPQKTAEHLAATCGTCVRQATRMLSGRITYGLHLPQIIAMGGRSFVAHVIVPFQKAFEHERITEAEDRLAVDLADERRALGEEEAAAGAGRRRGRLSRAVAALGARLSQRVAA